MTVAIARKVLDIEVRGLLSVKERLGEEFSQAVSMIMTCPSRLVVTGIGKSGLVGQKISATMNSTGTPAFFLHPVEAMHGDLGMLSATDVILAISYSGETSELNSLLTSISGRGISIIAMSGNKSSTLADFADIVLDISVPEEACPLGLAPTASTTATLALGDALAVALLQRKEFKAEDFRRNHPGGSLGERLKLAVSEVMITGSSLPVVKINASLPEAITVLNDKNIGVVIVLDENRVAGILTDGDIRRLVLDNKFPDLSLSDVMSKTPITVADDVMAADALSIIQKHEITVLPVVGRDNVLLGVIHLHNLLGKGEFRFLI